MSFVCVICEENLAFRDPAVTSGPNSLEYVQINSTQCGHVFHRHCLKDWFAAQTKKQRESYDPRQQLLRTQTTCPSCSRQANLTGCIRIFLTEDGNESFNLLHNNNIKTKAALNEEINALRKTIKQMEAGKIKSDSEILELKEINENLSSQKDVLEFELEELKVTVSNLQQVPAEPVLNLEIAERMNGMHLMEQSSNSLDESSHDTSYESSADISLVLTERANLNAITPNQHEIETAEVTTGGLTTGDIVVWIRELDNEIGSVLWIGKISGVIFAGVKFINRIGNSSGEANGQKLFTCDINYGRMVAVRELILYKDFFGIDNRGTDNNIL